MQIDVAATRPQVATLVRPAMGADLVWMVVLWQQMMRRHERAHVGFALAENARETWEASVWDMMARHDSFVLVVERAGFCCGWVARHPAIYRAQHVGLLSEIAVAKRTRRRGVGTALLAAARAWFLSRELEEFQLATAIFNGSAQRFFRAQGGTPLLMRYHFLVNP